MTSNDTQRFWQDLLANVSIPTPLVVDRFAADSRNETRAFVLQQIDLSEDLTTAIHTLLDEHNLNVETLLMAGWALLLNRYNGQDDIVFGTNVPSTTSMETAIDDTSQPTEHALPIRLHVSQEEPLLGWLDSIQQIANELNEYSTVSPAQIISWCNLPENVPIFESVFVGQSAKVPPENCLLQIGARTGSSLRLQIEYDSQRFETGSIERMLGHLQSLLAGIIANPQGNPSSLLMLTEKEKHQLLDEWNDTAIDFPRDRCLHELFEDQAAINPDAVAVIFNDEQLNYADLNGRANQLANYLRELGVGPNVPVGICASHSVDMVVGLLAIVKAGGAILPIDPEYPRDRIAFMLSDTDVSVLLTQDPLLDRLPDQRGQVVRLDSDWNTISRQSTENLDSDITPENLLYIIYTSGSTGTPKGVLLDHCGRVNNFADFNRRFDIGPGDRLIALSSLSFDMCAYDVFGTLMCGATIVMPGDRQWREPAGWAELMVQHAVTIWHSAPAMMKMLVECAAGNNDLCPRKLRLVLLGGDWIPLSLPDELRKLVPNVCFVSMGGATECSMDSTIFVVDEVDPQWNSIPYGRPMANQTAYILDSHLRILPVGVPGELHLGGIGIASGYQHQPELTAEKFIRHPYSDDSEARIYKTGDLARMGSDGVLELLGRIDNQVKIRGYRIELGEIEATMRRHPAVKEAIAIAREDIPGEKRLVGYLVQDLDYEAPAEKIEQWQSEQVAQWKNVYDSAYVQPSLGDNATFNIASWNSSYTDEPIPSEEMREWVDNTVDRILDLNPNNALEIGCGTGLLLSRIAPRCQSYRGTDISQVALDHVRQHIHLPESCKVLLEDRMADDFSGIDRGTLDTVILNSIVLDFPGIDYLVSVLKQSADAIADGGHIFVGDVRGTPLREAFYTSVQLFRAEDSATGLQLQDRIKKQNNLEEELLIDPAFFVALTHQIPRLTHVSLLVKDGHGNNEMIRFRYDAILHIGSESNQLEQEAEWLDWQEIGLSLDGLRQQLADSVTKTFCIERIPNSRVFSDVAAMRLLNEADNPESVADIRRALHQLSASQPAVDPGELKRICEETGYHVELRVSPHEADGCMDAVLTRKVDTAGSSASSSIPCRFITNPSHPLKLYANNPLQSQVTRRLVPEVREQLKAKLPDYMVPSAFVLLEELPLTPNGKVNRKSLPVPDVARSEMDIDYTAPRNPVEQVVAEAWADVLGLEIVGSTDNFLDLGGHSLLAYQIVTRLREAFPIELSLQDFFNCLTVASLAERLVALGRDAGYDIGEIAEIVLQVSALSEDEVQTMLTNREAAVAEQPENN